MAKKDNNDLTRNQKLFGKDWKDQLAAATQTTTEEPVEAAPVEDTDTKASETAPEPAAEETVETQGQQEEVVEEEEADNSSERIAELEAQVLALQTQLDAIKGKAEEELTTKEKEKLYVEQVFDRWGKTRKVDPDEQFFVNLKDYHWSVAGEILDTFVPVPKGGSGTLEATPGSGKSAIATRTLLASASAQAEDHMQLDRVCYVLLDERPQEGTRQEDDLANRKQTEIVSLNAEFVVASKQLEACQAMLDKFDLTMAKYLEYAMAGEDVMVIVDSMSRLADLATTCITNDPLGTGGIGKSAIRFINQVALYGGKVDGGGSLTFIGTALADDVDKGKQTVIQHLRSKSNFNVLINENLPFPRIDLDNPKCQTRWRELLKNRNGEYKEHLMFRRSQASRNGSSAKAIIETIIADDETFKKEEAKKAAMSTTDTTTEEPKGFFGKIINWFK